MEEAECTRWKASRPFITFWSCYGKKYGEGEKFPSSNVLQPCPVPAVWQVDNCNVCQKGILWQLGVNSTEKLNFQLSFASPLGQPCSSSKTQLKIQFQFQFIYWIDPLANDIQNDIEGRIQFPPSIPCVAFLTWQCLQTGARDDVPHLDRRVGVARDEDVVPQLHPRGQRLVPLFPEGEEKSCWVSFNHRWNVCWSYRYHGLSLLSSTSLFGFNILVLIEYIIYHLQWHSKQCITFCDTFLNPVLIFLK